MAHAYIYSERPPEGASWVAEARSHATCERDDRDLGSLQSHSELELVPMPRGAHLSPLSWGLGGRARPWTSNLMASHPKDGHKNIHL